MTIPPRQFVPPLDFRTPIVDPNTGQPTLQFIQLWQQTQGNETGTNAEITTIQAEVDAVEVDITALQAAAVPPGGATSYVLTKDSGADYDMSWQPGGGGGGGGGSPFQGALVYRTTDLTAQDFTAGVVIDWQAEEYDEGAFYDNAASASRLVIPSGVTRAILSGQIRINSISSGAAVLGRVRKNGSIVFTGYPGTVAAAGSGNAVVVNFVSPVLDVAATDYFDVELQLAGDSSVDLTASGSWFAIEAVPANSGGGSGTGGIWAPLVTGALPGPELVATGDGQCVMVQIG